MEPLVTNRQCLIWLRICPADEFTSRRQKLAYTIFAVFVVIGLVCGLAGSLSSGWKFMSIDLGESVYAFVYSIALIIVLFMALVGQIVLPHKIVSIFDNLKAIYKACECCFIWSLNFHLRMKPKHYYYYLRKINTYHMYKTLSHWITKCSCFSHHISDEDADSFPLLARVNNISEWMLKMYFKIMTAATIVNFVVVPLISDLFKWAINKNFRVETFYHPAPYL